MPRQFEIDEDDCIGCGLCSERAPENLETPTGSMVAQVFKQPETPVEEEACLEAAEYCPTGGLRARRADPALADCETSDDRAALGPAGDSRPAGTGLTEWRDET